MDCKMCVPSIKKCIVTIKLRKRQNSGHEEILESLNQRHKT